MEFASPVKLRSAAAELILFAGYFLDAQPANAAAGAAGNFQLGTYEHSPAAVFAFHCAGAIALPRGTLHSAHIRSCERNIPLSEGSGKEVRKAASPRVMASRFFIYRTAFRIALNFQTPPDTAAHGARNPEKIFRQKNAGAP